MPKTNRQDSSLNRHGMADVVVAVCGFHAPRVGGNAMAPQIKIPQGAHGLIHGHLGEDENTYDIEFDLANIAGRPPGMPDPKMFKRVAVSPELIRAA